MPLTRPDAELPLPDDAGTAAYCGRCGEELVSGDHGACARYLELEPPRYCGQCRRRMKVQVAPGTWTATCVRHGTVEHSTWA